MMRLYGVDTGSLKPETAENFKTCPEIELYYMINTLGGILWRLRHDSADGRIPTSEKLLKEMHELQYAIEYLVLQTARFGTKATQPKDGDHVEKTEEYARWFRWWDRYADGLSEETIKEIDSCLKSGIGIEKFRPEGDWKERDWRK